MRAPRVLKANARSTLVLSAPGAALVSFCLWQAWRERDLGDMYFYGVMAAVVIAGFVLMLLKPDKLALDQDGFTWRSALGGLSAHWLDLAEMGIASPKGMLARGAWQAAKPGIGFNYLPGREPKRGGWVRDMNLSYCGYQRRFPNLWDISSEELLSLMQTYWDAARPTPDAEGRPQVTSPGPKASAE